MMDFAKRTEMTAHDRFLQKTESNTRTHRELHECFRNSPGVKELSGKIWGE